MPRASDLNGQRCSLTIRIFECFPGHCAANALAAAFPWGKVFSSREEKVHFLGPLLIFVILSLRTGKNNQEERLRCKWTAGMEVTQSVAVGSKMLLGIGRGRCPFSYKTSHT